MEWYQAMILGLVEGLTEYLPVSSTGHLILAQRVMGIPASVQADAYAICIQAGAIVAVLGLYWKRVAGMVRGMMGRDAEGLKLLINVAAAFAPAAVIGLLLEKRIESLMQSLWWTVAAWLVGGVTILLVVWWKRNGGPKSQVPGPKSQVGGRQSGKELSGLTWQLAMVIGFAQCLAMWPGVSRSLITIVGGLLVGLRLAAAVEFSFLLGVVTLGGAACYKATKYGDVMLQHYGAGTLLIGFLFAFLFAALAIKWMVAYLQKHSLAVFGWYRVALAAVVAALILMKVLA